jgi:hypothetical protein
MQLLQQFHHPISQQNKSAPEKVAAQNTIPGKATGARQCCCQLEETRTTLTFDVEKRNYTCEISQFDVFDSNSILHFD